MKRFKKGLIILFITFYSVFFTTSISIAKTEVIPDEAVRLRILANSDSKKDQEMKRKIRDEVNAQILTWVHDLTSFEEAKKVIQKNMPEVEKTVADILKEEKKSVSYKVEFKKSKFPTKAYGNIIYPAGTYETVLITLGEGEGANWWCVLFPPLCFLDFSTGQIKEDLFEEEAPVEVKFAIVEWVKQGLKKLTT